MEGTIRVRLADDIRRMIDLILDRYAVDPKVHERWLRMSGGSGVPEPDYLPLVVKGFDRSNPDEWKHIWPERHLTREEVRTCSRPDDYSQCRSIRKAIEFVQYAQSVLPSEIPVGLFFMMSPYDLAYLARGDELSTL